VLRCERSVLEHLFERGAVAGELALEGEVQEGLGEAHHAARLSVRVKLESCPHLGLVERDPGMDWQRSFEHPEREHATGLVFGDLDKRGELLATWGAVHLAQARTDANWLVVLCDRRDCVRLPDVYTGLRADGNTWLM
jgi:hypothetical protein